MSARHFRSNRQSQAGFTLFELLVSVAILTLISTATVMTLNASRPGEELRAATRVIENDINNVETRALAGANVDVCDTVGGPKVCSSGNTAPEICVGSCVPTAPPRFGVHMETDGIVTAVFADLDDDGRFSSDREVVENHPLHPLTAPGAISPVFFSSPSMGGTTYETMDVVADRQSGKVWLVPCTGGVCHKPWDQETGRISVRHRNSDLTYGITVDPLTGRVNTSL